MTKGIKWIIGAVIIVAVVAIGYSLYKSQNKPSVSAEPIRVGGIYPLTGPVAAFGEQIRNGFLLGVEEVNKSGGVKGRKIEFIIEDGQMDPKVSVSAFTKLVDINKVKIVSSVGSSVELAIKPLAEEKGIFFFAGSAHPAITENSNLIVRHANIASNDALLLAEAVKKESPNKIAIMHINDDWGTIFESEFRKSLGGIEIMSESHGPKDTDMRSQLSKIIAFNPDVVVISSFGPALGLNIKQIRELGYQGKIFVNNGLILSPEAQNIVGKDNLKGIYYQDYPGQSEAFKKSYKERFNSESGAYSMFMYTNVELLKYAIENVGEDPAEIASFIKGLKEFKGRFETVKIAPSGDMIIDLVVKIWE